MISKTFQFFLITVFLIMPCDLLADKDNKWLSNDLKEEYTRYGNRDLSFLNDSLKLEPRPNLVSTVWWLASKGSPVDNRAYLFALAIDLYNSIPADLLPEPEELADGEDVYEPNLWAIKSQLYFNQISTIDGNEPVSDVQTLEMKKNGLERFKKRLFKRFKENSPEANARLTADLEYTYLRQHIREQVVLGNILIDDQKAPASMNLSELNIYNPKYYAELKEYMTEVQPLIDKFIPPWETEKPLTAATKASNTDNRKPQTAVIEPTTPAQKFKPATPKLNVAPKSIDDRIWYGIGIFVLLIIGGLLIYRRR